MYRISREFSFPMAHRLSKHKGRCQFIHGHNYNMIVGVKSAKLNDNDMVMDFGDLKKIVENYIDLYFDHSLALNKNDSELEEKLKETMPETRVCLYYEDPTAEIMARNIYEYVQSQLPNLVMMDYVTIYENDKSEATYEE